MDSTENQSKEGLMPPMCSAGAPRLTFGIYPGGTLASTTQMSHGKPNDPARIKQAVDRLRGGRPFIMRCYLHYTDTSIDWSGHGSHPPDFLQYAGDGRTIDLVLSYTSKSGNVAGWLEFVKEAVRRYGPKVAMLQVTEEPNLTISPVIDGSFPNVKDALVQGVIAAKEDACRAGLDNLQIGFSAVPFFEADDWNHDFFKTIGAMGGEQFVQSLDYVGLDIFPDVFYPLPPSGLPGDIRHFTEAAMRSFRETSLPLMGIPATLPLHIAENGWPTGYDRSYERQAEVVETLIRTVNEYRGNYNVTHYEMFDLRDADSADPGIFSQFGLLRDDYTPKPAFEVYRKLVDELSV